jgi:carbamoyltransferase
MAKPTYVLGTGLSHDGSACLLRDGELCVAIEKERVSRVKHDGFNDSAAIRYCLKSEGISLDDVSVTVQNANFGMLESGNSWFHGPRPFSDNHRVVTISHHLAHAYSAIGTCPFDDAAVLIVDGCGSSWDDCTDLQGVEIPESADEHLKHGYFEKDSYYVYTKGRLRTRYKDFSPWGFGLKEYLMHPMTTMHSIGGVYQAASAYVFSGFDDSGKLMGLAPYGRPAVFEDEIFTLRDGRVFVRYDWMYKFSKPARTHEQFKKDFQYYADIAYWVQKELERAIFYVINARYEMEPANNLCYAGGVALNAVANAKILENSKYRKLYIQPAAGDNGLAIGCAYYGWLEVLKGRRVTHSGTTYLGTSYPEKRMEAALRKYADQWRISKSDNYVDQTCELLATGKTIAWYSGGSEFGPRALGHRSILADPRRGEVRDQINRDIKLREDFRPFAPAVLAEDAHQYFECSGDSPYMLVVAKARPHVRDSIKAVVHEDDSSRIQTVTEELNPAFYRLLRQFKKLTGVGILLNTSMNRRGMPIVETPEQAVEFFASCPLDALVLGRIVVEKPQAWRWNPVPPLSLGFSMLEDLVDTEGRDLTEIGGVIRINIAGASSIVLNLNGNEPLLVRPESGSEPDVTLDLSEYEFVMLAGSTRDELSDALNGERISVHGDICKAGKLFERLRTPSGHRNS